MLQRLSISELYPFALAEGEGVGTAYEYLAKRLTLAPWLQARPVPKRILINGLPEKYGCSLDFALLAAELGAHLTVIDERPAALKKFESALALAQEEGNLSGLSFKTLLTPDLDTIPEECGEHDLSLSSEVLQRLHDSKRSPYLTSMRRRSKSLAVFCPNADNPAHTNLSGLAGIGLERVRELSVEESTKIGFIDMPPFPPGLTRTDKQREQASTGRLEAVAMFGLGVYVRLERFFPRAIRRKQSHIVYALSHRA